MQLRVDFDASNNGLLADFDEARVLNLFRAVHDQGGGEVD